MAQEHLRFAGAPAVYQSDAVALRLSLCVTLVVLSCFFFLSAVFVVLLSQLLPSP